MEAAFVESYHQQHLTIKLLEAKIHDLASELSDQVWVHTKEGVRAVVKSVSSPPVLDAARLSKLPGRVLKDAPCLLYLTGYEPPLPDSPSDPKWPAAFAAWLRENPNAVKYVVACTPAPADVFCKKWSSESTWETMEIMWAKIGLWVMQLQWQRLSHAAGLPMKPFQQMPAPDFL